MLTSHRTIKKNFRALLKGQEHRWCVSSISSVAEKNDEKNKRTHLKNMWLKDWCHGWNLGFFNHGVVCIAPGLLYGWMGFTSLKGEKKILFHELAGLIETVLN